MTSDPLLAKAAQHEAQARAISDEFEGRAMPAEAAHEMEQHRKDAAELRDRASLPMTVDDLADGTWAERDLALKAIRDWYDVADLAEAKTAGSRREVAADRQKAQRARHEAARLADFYDATAPVFPEGLDDPAGYVWDGKRLALLRGEDR